MLREFPGSLQKKLAGAVKGSIGPWTGSQKSLNLHPSLDNMSYMTLDKSLNLPETWLYYLKNESNVNRSAYLMGLMIGSPKRQTQTQPLHRPKDWTLRG